MQITGWSDILQGGHHPWRRHCISSSYMSSYDYSTFENGSKCYDYNAIKSVAKSYDYNAIKSVAKSYDYNAIDVGQNPTLNYMRRIVTCNMDMLVGLRIAGRNPTQQLT